MTERTDANAKLVRLTDSELILKDHSQDVLGHDVFDDSGELLGSVEDLYLDEARREVRFLEVAAGGLLGMGEKRFLIPVEAVREVGEGSLAVDHGREEVAGSPPLETGVVPRSSYLRDVYDHYGYSPGRPDAGPGAWPGGV